jgi:hypothetical protein
LAGSTRHEVVDPGSPIREKTINPVAGTHGSDSDRSAIDGARTFFAASGGAEFHEQNDPKITPSKAHRARIDPIAYGRVDGDACRTHGGARLARRPRVREVETHRAAGKPAFLDFIVRNKLHTLRLADCTTRA